jgi:hypothetical protein
MPAFARLNLLNAEIRVRNFVSMNPAIRGQNLSNQNDKNPAKNRGVC